MKYHTLFLIKPNATKINKIGSILKIIEDNDFEIERLKMFKMDDDIASRFYAEHKGKFFYEKLLKFMKSGNTVAAVLKRENAVNYLRKVVGVTDPQKAKSNTIRNLYGEDVTYNAVHASDSIEHAKREISIIFPDFTF